MNEIKGKWYSLAKMDHPVLHGMCKLTIHKFEEDGTYNRSVQFSQNNNQFGENWSPFLYTWQIEQDNLYIKQCNQNKLERYKFKIVGSCLILESDKVKIISYRTLKEALDNPDNF